MSHAATIPVEVTAVEQVTPLIKEFTLAAVAGAELPAFSGGSHVIVVLRRKDRTFRNPYSLMSSPPERGRYRIAVRRHDDGRGGSLYLHEQVRVGTRLEISHPVNLFPLARLARKHILVAGGVGITPMTAMIADLHDGRVPWELHYVVRGPEHDYFGRQLLEGGGPVHLYYGSAGLDLGRLLAGQPLGTNVYTCGPAGMIESVARAARAAGWADSHVYHEEFTAPPLGQAFDVQLARSDLTVHVPPGRSLLEAIEAVGVHPPYLCRGGVCGECETDVLDLEGELIHNDHWLSAEQKAGSRKIMPCVSRARCTRLVLDR
jgi:ferredoxin-NADP reductase